MLTLVLISILILLMINIQLSKAEPTTIIVPDDYPTIQEAINAASDGDTIFVRSGIYYENVVVNKAVSLIGESKQNTIIDGNGIGKVLELTVDGILVSNFSIINGEVGVHITNSHRHIIKNNIISRNVRGATGTYYTYTTYESNIIRENEYGLDFGHLGGPSSSNNFAIGNEIYDNFVGIYVSAPEGENAIENNLIYNNNIGIVLDNTRNNNVVGNTFINNTREGRFKHGIYIRNAAQNNIEGNIFIQNNVGVFMDRGYCNIIQKNNFTSNFYGVYLTFNESLTYIGWSFDNQILKNYFLNNTYGIYSNIGAAVFINSQFNTTISENELKNNLYGVFLYLSPVNRILENTISLNDHGIHIELSSGNYLINNSIIENTANGIALHLANDNSLISNNISKCDVGITLSLSSSNLICRNVIANNNIGVKTELSNDNTIYNNDFIRNVQHVTTDGLSSNKWNATYPYGGNYWSDYNGTDTYRGPYQNETGSDGIGDTPSIVDINEIFDTYNIDYYPLMNPFVVKCYIITIISGVGGTTNPTPGTYMYTAGTELNVTAIPESGYSFDYWLLDSEMRTENPIAVVMDENHTLEAYFVDDIPPVTTDDYDGLWHKSNFRITLIATDYGSGIAETYYRINDGPVKAVSVDGQPVITTEGANNTLEYWSVDCAGNEEPHKFLAGIKLDKIAPSSSIATNGILGENDWFISDVNVDITAIDNLSGVCKIEYSFDNVTWTEYMNPLVITAENYSTIYYRAIDVAGNIESTKFELIKLDKTSPVTSIHINGLVGSDDWFASNVTVTLIAEDLTSGVNKTLYSFDNSSWMKYSDPFTITSKGSTTIYFKSVDNAGNIENVKVEMLKVDVTPPNIQLSHPSAGEQIKSSAIDVSWSGSDEVSGINHYEIRLDDGSWIDVGAEASYTFAGLADGEHKVTIKAVDKAGNVKEESVEFIVNTSLIGSPGWTDDTIVFSAIAAIIIGLIAYLIKRR